MVKDKYDVIIIGAGISGLIAGTHLAKNGLKVLIVDKNNIAGGCYTSFRRNGFMFDAGAQVIGSSGRSNVLGSILNSLEVDIDFVKLKVTDLVHFPKETMPVDGDSEKFKTYLKERFKTEKDNIERFFKIFSEADGSLKILYVMRKYADFTYQQVLDGFFKNDILKSIFSSQAGYLGLPPKKVSAVSAILLLKTYIIDGAYYPMGSSQALSDAIVGTFKKFGGTLLLNSEVKKILIRTNTAKGILLDDMEFLSDFIIIASDIKRAYTKLLEPNQIRINREFYTKLNRFKLGDSGCILYLGISKNVNLENMNGWYYSSYDINRAFKTFMNVHTPTQYDKSLSKSGDNILIATFPFCYAEDRKTERKEFKINLMKKLLSRLEERIPEIKGNIIMKELATPLTIERYTFNSGGSLYGWAQLPNQTHKNCFPIGSPVKGLFHAGHWTLPGGGIVAVATSGINAAKRILKKIEMSRKTFITVPQRDEGRRGDDVYARIPRSD
ncbi:MAG: NAD(P)/FAD-dependent oxidoreductase [Candidatus Omnitrophota bacterium]